MAGRKTADHANLYLRIDRCSLNHELDAPIIISFKTCDFAIEYRVLDIENIKIILSHLLKRMCRHIVDNAP